MIRGSVAEERGPSLPSLSQRLQEAPLSRRQQDILDMMVNRPRTGRTWDNRLGGGEEQARLNDQERRRRQEIRRLQREGRGRASGGIIGLQAGGQVPSTRSVTMTSRRRNIAHSKALAAVRGAGGTITDKDMEQLPNGDWSFTITYTVPEGRASGGVIGLQTGGPASVAGYGTPSQFNVRTEALHPGVAGAYGDLTQRIQDVGNRPLQQFGPGVAGFTGMEAQSQAALGAYGAGQGPQSTLQAQSTLGQAARGIGSMIPQQQALASQYGAMAPQALQQAQAGATGMQQLAGRAQLQGQLAGAGMRTTGAAAQTEQQALGLGQATAGQAAQAQQQQLGAEQERRGAIAQTQMQGLGQHAQQAGQTALGAQQGYATGMTGLGTQAGAQGQAGQAQFGALGTAAGQLGQTAMGQMGQTGQQSQQQAQEAAQRMRDIGGQAPQLQKGADMSDYMSQYTAGVTDPQLQQLLEFQKMQGQELGSQAAGAGAFGGLRQGVQAATQARDVSQQAADIIGKGQQEAFQSAQAAFQADRAAQQQAQQTGLSAEQQAAATQAGAQGQALQAQQAGVGAAQAGGAQQLQAAQQGQAAGQAGISAQMQAQQQAAGMADVGVGRQMQGLQAQVGATGQGIQFGQQGLEAQRAAAQVGAGQQQQGLAAQQAAAAQGTQFGLQGQQQGFQAAQAGTQLGLAGLQAAQQAGQQGYGTAANLMQGQQGAMGAQTGAYGQLAGIGGQQMQLGAQEQNQFMARQRMAEQAGERQRQLQQSGLDYQRAQFEQRQQHPMQQIGWMNQQLGALPYQSTVTQGAYTPQAGGASNILGMGLQGLGLYNAYQNRNAQNATPAELAARAAGTQ